MNTDIQFRISAPASLSIFGEHAKNGLRASIDLRTTLAFQEVPASLSNYIEIRFFQINLLHKISLEDFSIFYKFCVKDINFLHKRVSEFLLPHFESINQKIFLGIFYYLIFLIKYKEQIEIKPFIIVLRTEFAANGEFMSLISLKVCLVACLLHWSCLQMGAHIRTVFDEIDLNNIYTYTFFCALFEKPVPESDLLDIIVCTYGSIIKYDGEQTDYERFWLPNRKILLVYLNETQDVEAQKQRIAELMNMSAEFANSILNDIDILTNTTYEIFKKIFDIYKNDELSVEMKDDYLLQQHKALETCTRENQSLLRMLGVSNIYLDKICKLAQKYGLSGKYTDLSNCRYAYIWYPYTNARNIENLKNKLKKQGFHVIRTNLFCTGVKFE